MCPKPANPTFVRKYKVLGAKCARSAIVIFKVAISFTLYSALHTVTIRLLWESEAKTWMSRGSSC